MTHRHTNLLLIHFFAALMLLVSACDGVIYAEKGNGKLTIETIDVKAFDMIDTRGNYALVLEEGDVEQVKVEADENLHKYINVRVAGRRLVIEDDEPIYSDEGITITITYKSLDDLTCSGASAVTNRGTLRSNNLSLNMSGAGAFELDVNTTDMRVVISGAGAIELSGQTESLTARMSGAGSLDAYDLIATEADVNLSGIGAAQVNVEDYLDATISGIGGISYKGNPTVKKNVSGLGSVSAD